MMDALDWVFVIIGGILTLLILVLFFTKEES